MSIPWESPMWHDRVAIAFSYPRDGWVLMAIMTAAFNQHVVIHCSDVFPPFNNLIEWLNKIADKNLPAEFEIDEEGISKKLIAKESHLDEDEIELVIEGKYWREGSTEGENRIFLHCRTERHQLVEEFAERLSTWLKNDYDLFGFGYRCKEDYDDGYGFDLRQLDIQSLIEKLPNKG